MLCLSFFKSESIYKFNCADKLLVQPIMINWTLRKPVHRNLKTRGAREIWTRESKKNSELSEHAIDFHLPISDFKVEILKHRGQFHRLLLAGNSSTEGMNWSVVTARFHVFFFFSLYFTPRNLNPLLIGHPPRKRCWRIRTNENCLLTFCTIRLSRTFCELISLPISTAILRRLPTIPVMSVIFWSISSSYASFVILGQAGEREKLNAKGMYCSSLGGCGAQCCLD